jgi:hypothetical protein
MGVGERPEGDDGVEILGIGKGGIRMIRILEHYMQVDFDPPVCQETADASWCRLGFVRDEKDAGHHMVAR